MNIEKMLEKYNSVEELKIFCSAQMKQIQTLTQKNKELTEKVEKLEGKNKELMKASAGGAPAAILGNPAINLGMMDDAKTIAQIQLKLLKDASFERELDTDEAKRVELYNRILKEEAAKDKPLQATVEVVSEAELLKLVE
jgi:DNA-binding transcriptional MerR regulator